MITLSFGKKEDYKIKLVISFCFYCYVNFRYKIFGKRNVIIIKFYHQINIDVDLCYWFKFIAKMIKSVYYIN